MLLLLTVEMYQSVCCVVDEVMAVMKLDNVQVAQTGWKSVSQQCWDHRTSIELDRVRPDTLFEQGYCEIIFVCGFRV